MNYYIFTIGVEDIHSKNPGKLYLDTFFGYSEEERQKILDAESASKNELMPMTKMEALGMFGVLHLGYYFECTDLRTKAQNTIKCMVNCEFELTREDLELIVKTSTIEGIKKYKIG
jgi:hypothetical protein